MHSFPSSHYWIIINMSWWIRNYKENSSLGITNHVMLQRLNSFLKIILGDGICCFTTKFYYKTLISKCFMHPICEGSNENITDNLWKYDKNYIQLFNLTWELYAVHALRWCQQLVGLADYLSNDLVLLLSNPIDLFHNPSGNIDNHSGY